MCRRSGDCTAKALFTPTLRQHLAERAELYPDGASELAACSREYLRPVSKGSMILRSKMWKFATFEKRGNYAYVTLNRPEVLNALHLEAHIELAQIWDEFAGDPSLRVAILTGVGDRAFCAGYDLKDSAAKSP